jgi:hypothetical protein
LKSFLVWYVCKYVSVKHSSLFPHKASEEERAFKLTPLANNLDIIGVAKIS